MKRILGITFLLLVLLVCVLLFNTFRLTSKQQKVEKVNPIQVDEAAINRLSEAIKLPTITYEDNQQIDTSAFLALHKLIETDFPLCDSLLDKTILAEFSILYHWKGKNPNLKPSLLMGHLDVVPIEDESRWEEAPFSGIVKDGFLWGRGSLDDKNSIWAILEGAEKLLKEGFQPERSIYFAFGHDEEVGGKGALAIVDHLKKQNIILESVLDEGMVITQGMMPGISKPVALVGLSEKGYANIKVSVEGTGGHSSMPPKETPVGILSHALSKIEDNQMPQRIDGAVEQMFEFVAPEMDFPLKLVFANRWLFNPIIKSILSDSPTTNATSRTTTAPTMLKGSIKANVLPSVAEAIINFRIIPGETFKDVEKHLNDVVNDDRVKIEVMPEANNPPSVAAIDNEAFTRIQKSILQVFPDVLTAPALTVATTDSRHYDKIADDVYRFMPILLVSEDISRIHGSNERISTEAYKMSIRFYYQFLKNS